MASMSAASSSSPFLDNEKLDFESVRALATSINQHLHALLANSKAWKSLKSKCTSMVKIHGQTAVEFSEHSVVSNLYWGIEAVDAAIRAKCPEERTSRLQNAEKMLQVPASISEQGTTADIPNDYMVCCSYFYLAIVRKLQKDEWQVAFHFLQALLVSPRLVQAEFSPELCQNILHLYIEHKRQEFSGRRLLQSAPFSSLDEHEVNQAMGWMAREYKAWMIYYQIMSDGEVSQKCSTGRGIAIPDQKSEHITNQMSKIVKCENIQVSSLALEEGCRLHSPAGIPDEEAKGPKNNILLVQNDAEAIPDLSQTCGPQVTKNSRIKCLKDILSESDSYTSISVDSCYSSSMEETFAEEYEENSKVSWITRKYPQAPESISPSEITACMSEASKHQTEAEANEITVMDIVSATLSNRISTTDLSSRRMKDIESHGTLAGSNKKHSTYGSLQLHDYRDCEYEETATSLSYQLHQLHYGGGSAPERKRKNTSLQYASSQIQKHDEEIPQVEQVRVLEKLISSFCFSEALSSHEEDYATEISTVYKLLHGKRGLKYSLLKDIILDQLLTAISTSKEEQVIRSSVIILSTIISGNKSAIEDLKRKGLQLNDLATALRRNVQEASILIYLTNPSPEEMKTLEILPFLVEVVCTSDRYKGTVSALLLTPRTAALMIIEVLVTAFDSTTNNLHLSRISTPRVLSGLLDVPGNSNLEELVSLAAVLVRCMRFDGQCRKYMSQFSPVAPFISLLRSNQKRAIPAALEYFHELLQMPRSSAINLLQQIRQEGSTDIMNTLLLLIQNSQPDYRLLAASLLLQLEMLEEVSGVIVHQEEAIKALLESLTCEQNFSAQALSASILSSLGGTYSWMGEPYTVAWLVKKAGLTLLHHKNMIKNYDFADGSLQDAGIEAWCGKLARHFVKFGTPVFEDLGKGLSSKSKRISRDCLTALTWLGGEVAKSSEDMQHNACEIVLSKIEQHVHPGVELEERLLACLCIYNYTLGRGMKNLIHFSEGVRESLRRLANVTWMAEELLRVADYIQPNKWRISCVHTQLLEVGHSRNGAVTALIFYRGLLCSGYADGSIKVWEIKGQTATLVHDRKVHYKAVTCFSLLEQGSCLLSGSSDKTIKVWQMDRRNFECIESIATKEPIQSICTYGQLIFTISQGHKMKVFDSSRNMRDVFKNKSVKCMKVSQGKVYTGCIDSSIQELMISNSRQQELKGSAKKWMMQSKPINSLVVYKDWLYCAGVVIEGAKTKDWRRNIKPEVSIKLEKGASVQAMEVVEDFIYLTSSASRSSLQIWLRGTQHKVGRLSAGSKITSLLSANDMILCGTETGIIKGWIPL